MTTHYWIETPVGTLKITLNQDKVTTLSLLATPPTPDALSKQDSSGILREIKKYFSDPAYLPDVLIEPEGTQFQKRIWKALQNIPVGTTLTYGQLATQLKTSPRAIGQACRKNPIPIIVPCHRITARNHIGGFAGKRDGDYLRVKKWLLMHEGVRPDSITRHETERG